MAQKYYNSKEAAQQLGIDVEEIKKMLDRRELHGYRDGADWKFKTEDIDRLVKERNAEPAETGGGDVLLSEVELGHSDPGTSGTVIAMNWGERGAPESDIQLSGSDIQLASDSNVSAAAKKPGDSSKSGPGKSTPPKIGPGASDIDLSAAEISDRSSPGAKPGSDYSLGSDSGISLVDPSDSGLSLEEPILSVQGDESLELGEDDMLSPGEHSGVMAPVEAKADEEFLLTPGGGAADAQDSESGSQVIALDSDSDSATMIGLSSGVGGTMAAMLDEDVSAPPATPMGLAAPVLGVPTTALMEGAPLMQAETALAETPYTGMQIAGLAACAVVLMFCGMMTFDLIRNMWSWNESLVLNSVLLEGLKNTVGL